MEVAIPQRHLLGASHNIQIRCMHLIAIAVTPLFTVIAIIKPYPLYPQSGASGWALGETPSYRHPVRHLFVNVRYKLFPRELWNANSLICILETLCILPNKLLTQISTQTLAGVDLNLYHRLAEVQSIEIQQGRRKLLEFGWTMYPMGQLNPIFSSAFCQKKRVN